MIIKMGSVVPEFTECHLGLCDGYFIAIPMIGDKREALDCTWSVTIDTSNEEWSSEDDTRGD